MRTILRAIIALLVLACFAAPAAAASYGARALCVWHDEQGVVRVAGAITYDFPAQSAANDRALEQAIERADRSGRTAKADCRVYQEFSAGQCLYMALGSSTAGVNVGFGPTGAKAHSACTAGGKYTCASPRGGCTRP